MILGFYKQIIINLDKKRRPYGPLKIILIMLIFPDTARISPYL